MLRVARRFASSFGVPLAARGGEKQIMSRNVFPLRLMQILANVLGVRVVGAVPFDRLRPMVRSPKNFDARIARTGTPSAESGEQINCCCHDGYSPAITGRWMVIRRRELEMGANRQSRLWLRQFLG